VTVAVPTELHRDIALPFSSAGIPVLVEKPIARSLRGADELDRGGADATSRSPSAHGALQPGGRRGRGRC